MTNFHCVSFFEHEALSLKDDSCRKISSCNFHSMIIHGGFDVGGKVLIRAQA